MRGPWLVRVVVRRLHRAAREVEWDRVADVADGIVRLGAYLGRRQRTRTSGYLVTTSSPRSPAGADSPAAVNMAWASNAASGDAQTQRPQSIRRAAMRSARDGLDEVPHLVLGQVAGDARLTNPCRPGHVRR